MNVLNTIEVLSVNYDKGITLLKMSVLIENKARAEIELDISSGISTVPIKRFRRIFQNYKIIPSDVHLRTATSENLKVLVMLTRKSLALPYGTREVSTIFLLVHQYFITETLPLFVILNFVIK